MTPTLATVDRPAASDLAATALAELLALAPLLALAASEAAELILVGIAEEAAAADEARASVVGAMRAWLEAAVSEASAPSVDTAASVPSVDTVASALSVDVAAGGTAESEARDWAAWSMSEPGTEKPAAEQPEAISIKRVEGPPLAENNTIRESTKATSDSRWAAPSRVAKAGSELAQSRQPESAVKMLSAQTQTPKTSRVAGDEEGAKDSSVSPYTPKMFGGRERERTKASVCCACRGLGAGGRE